MSTPHQEALAHLLYGTENDGCIVLLTGDVGTGKTTLCRCMVDRLPDHAEYALVLNPSLTISELLKTICEEFGVSVPPHPVSNKVYIDLLNTYFLTAHAAGKNCILIIDEAQNLEMDVLEQLRLLTNLETDDQKLLKIVLLGQSELRDTLRSEQLAQINQRITTRYHLHPLPADEVKNYINHRIVLAGGPGISLFSRKAVHHIITFSRGIPRKINLICNQALLGAYAGSKELVTAKIARTAAGEVLEGPPGPLSVKQRPVFMGLFLIFLTCLLLFFLTTGKINTFGKLFSKDNSWVCLQKNSDTALDNPLKTSTIKGQ
ncbi:ExeA family protein [Desulfomarina sp.]